MATTDRLEAALDYARRGWPAFPCKGKRPLARHAPHGLKDATTDLGQTRRRWTDAPQANIALRTGVEFDVLDVDGDEGLRSLALLVDGNGCLSSSPVVITPGGGLHYYFLPTGLGNRTGIRPGLDWRAVGGYVIAPPSIHPNGGRYEWAIGPDEQELEPPPRWLVELVRRPAAPPSVTPASAQGSPYGQAALERELGRLVSAPVGQRNDQLNRSAHALGQLVGAGHLDVDEAGQALLNVALRIGLGQSEARATIVSGLTAGIQTPRKVAS